MSRYNFQDAEGHSWSVGYDAPMVTFFAQHEDAAGELEDVAGDSVGDVTTVAALRERLEGRVELPTELQRQLEREQPTFTAAPIARAIAHEDQLKAHLRDGLNLAEKRGPELER